MSLRDQPTTKAIPSLAGAGVPFAAGAAELGLGIQATAEITLSGASPHVLTFASMMSQTGKAIHPPLDSDYVPICVSNGASVVDLANCTLAQVQLTGGSAADKVRLIIISRFGAMKR